MRGQCSTECFYSIKWPGKDYLLIRVAISFDTYCMVIYNGPKHAPDWDTTPSDYRFTQVTIQLTLDHGFRTVAIDLIALLLADL